MMKTIYSVQIQGTLIFTASTRCLKILNVKSIFNTVKNFKAHSVFQGKCKVAQNPVNGKIIFNPVKISRENSVFSFISIQRGRLS